MSTDSGRTIILHSNTMSQHVPSGAFFLAISVRHLFCLTSSMERERFLLATFGQTTTNQYGQHPFYLVMESISDSNQTPSGQMHGVLLLNSNAMDYSFGPDPSVTIRTIGGVLDFFMFLGPTPEEVVQQYTWLVGRPVMPPYWSLGFQLSRWGYMNLTNMKKINQRNRAAGVPLDVQFADIDYMDAMKDFTIDPVNFTGLKDFFNELHADGLRTMIILDPGTFNDQLYYTPTIEGLKNNVYITWSNGTPMEAVCWPGALFMPGENRCTNRRAYCSSFF